MGNDLILNDQSAIISFTHTSDGGINLPKPFEREIHLFDTYIAGTSYVKEIADGTATLETNEKLLFFREPDNRFDKNAIVIKKQNNQKVGYVPRQDNIVFSRLMDAGKELFGRVTSVETRGTLLKIKVRIFLSD